VVDNVAVTTTANNGLVASGANIGMLVSNSTITGNGGGLHEANSGVSTLLWKQPRQRQQRQRRRFLEHDRAEVGRRLAVSRCSAGAGLKVGGESGRFFENI